MFIALEYTHVHINKHIKYLWLTKKIKHAKYENFKKLMEDF